MRLGIDLDGVVAKFIAGWMLRYNLEFGTNLTEDQVTYWDAARDLTHFDNLDDFWDWAGASGNGSTVFRNLEPYPGAIEALTELARDHDLVILSMKCDWAAADTFRWIGDQHIPTREIHLIRDKWKVDCDVYIDDSPFALPELVARRPDAVVCRFVRAWNDPVPGAIDVHDWDEFVSLVEKVSVERECTTLV